MTAEGTKDDPWQLTTAPGGSAYTMYRDEDVDRRLEAVAPLRVAIAPASRPASG